MALLALTVLSGCRNDGSQREAYIRDLRLHEDQIYELRDHMQEYQELLAMERRENAQLRSQLKRGQKPAGEEADLKGEDEERSLLDPPERGERPEIMDFDEDELPSIDGGEAIPPGMGRRNSAGGERMASAEVSGRRGRSNRRAVFTPPAAPTEPATSVAIYAEQMPLEPNGQSGPPEVGLMAIVEPLTATGTAGDFEGEMSLMIVDPIAEQDGDWQIARWDYTAEEVEAAWRDTSRRVLDLPLASPPATPVGRPLELWVRLVPANGAEKILSHTMIELAAPARLVGVPVSGTRSMETGEIVSSGWQAAEPVGKPKESVAQGTPSEWRPATELAPAAIGRTRIATEAPAAKPEAWAPKR